MAAAWTFPGQGSQSVGAGRPFADLETFALVEVIAHRSGVDVEHLLLRAPREELARPEHTQLVVFATCVLALTYARPLLAEATLLAGHSLGEVTALWAAGAITLEGAIDVVVARSATTDAVARTTTGAMAAVLGLSFDDVATVCAAEESVWVANDNCPGQVVITGLEPGISATSNRLREAGGKVVRLPIGGAFHCPVMAPAREAFFTSIRNVGWRDAEIAVVSNADAVVRIGRHDWATLLADQLVGNVRWVQCTKALVDNGVTTAIEFGPGAVLTGLTRRNAPGLARHCVSSPADLDSLLDSSREEAAD